MHNGETLTQPLRGVNEGAVLGVHTVLLMTGMRLFLCSFLLLTVPRKAVVTHHRPDLGPDRYGAWPNQDVKCNFTKGRRLNQPPAPKASNIDMKLA